MKNDEECSREADKLRGSHPYFRWPHPGALAGWRRYGGCCVYCDKNLMADWEALWSSAHTDHLLPRKYKALLWHHWNLVLCCSTCNILKRHYDANSDLPTELRYESGPLTSEQHTAILELCRREVRERRRKKQEDMENALACWNGID
jgi:5-methylcytosine-specific restriction endonuclease McrA